MFSQHREEERKWLLLLVQMCGGTLTDKIHRNHPDLLGQEIVLQKVVDQVLCQHFPIKIKILITSTGPEIKITHLEDPQVEALVTAQAPWDQAVTWTRGWTGAGWWTMCSRRR